MLQEGQDKLGSFYLGAEYDLEAGARKESSPIFYDSRDLVTHGVVVGMTGSGKTGLCVGLLEEAALDRVPAIIIDPKGDMANLLLQFPQLRPEDFKPWVNEGDATRKDKTVDEFAASTAEQWRSGLADWGIGSERIQRTLDTVQYTVYTPGSDAGIPVNIMGSLAAPKLDWATEAEAIRERINGTVAALMGLAGITADTMRSREAVLLAGIFEHYWKQGQDLDLGKLILSIQKPPMAQVGVFDVETFYPGKDRFELAMLFNTLMAAPTFQSWLAGDPLDVETLLYTHEGKPRHSIFYIAHLSDSERMFFVTLLLENLVTWMRRQSGTTSLRALLYFDEIFGFFPPTAEPPSKRPLLTLMKQARAFGLGVLLVTQNPVDLDYKGLTNAGTWLIGKLQAERDKERVLAGLKGALSEVGTESDVDYDRLITRLGSRIFLLHNVHDERPVTLTTRWAQSYLRGPLTRMQVRDLMADHKPVAQMPVAQAQAAPAATTAVPAPPDPAGAWQGSVAAPPQPVQAPPVQAPAVQAAPAAPSNEPPPGFLPSQPVVKSGVTQVFLPVQIGERAAIADLEREGGSIPQDARVRLTYEPAALGAAEVHFVDRKRDVETDRSFMLVTPLPEGPGRLDWGDAEKYEFRMRDLRDEPENVQPGQGPFFKSVPPAANTATDLKKIESDLEDWLYYNARFPVKTHEELEITQRAGETEGQLVARLDMAARERRDAEVDELEDYYGKKIDAIANKLAKEEQELAQDKAEVMARRGELGASVLETAMGWFMGRRSTRGVSSGLSKYRMQGQAAADVAESEQAIARFKSDIDALQTELAARSQEIAARWEKVAQGVATVELAPRRSDVKVELVALAWLPQWLVEFEANGRTYNRTVAACAPPQ